MRYFCVFIFMLFVSVFVFAQTNFIIIGRVPQPVDERLYLIQVGAFHNIENARRVYERLVQADLSPAFERHNEFVRVLVPAINSREIQSSLNKIRNAGFNEALIRIDNITARQVPRFENLPVSDAVIPSPARREIASRTIRIGEVRNLGDLVNNRTVTYWASSTPSAAIVSEHGVVSGLAIGNAYIEINEREYISIAIVPREDFFVVPQSMSSLLPADSSTGSSSERINEYRTEPTFRLSYRFNNRGENRGASGTNGGIDILGRGVNYQWLWTTFFQGGWFYNLNGVMREMVDGFQRGANGVTLTISPEFVYDKGVPYLQLKHLLHNTNNFPVTSQRFGASADVMIHENDYASLELTSYGAYMTDNRENPSLELMFVCLEGAGITPVDTLWLGTYSNGNHLNYIYTDRRTDVHYADSAIGFSYQNIDLAANETKEFIVRFTLARLDD